MTVIKALFADSVRALPSATIAASLRTNEPVDDPRIAELSAQLGKAEAMLVSCREQATAEIALARKEGAAAAKGDEEQRLARIEEGVKSALAAWRECLSDLEHLAAGLAEAALAKLFDDYADLADLVGRTLARRIRAIGAGASLRVRVSAQDFADQEALQALALRCGMLDSAIVAETDAASGACEIDLAVGHLDLTIASQCREIERCLTAIASEKPA